MVERLIVGLGNPGEEYELTPHNLGFLVIDRLAESHAIRVSRKENDMSRVGLGSIGGKRVALAKPQTYMNRSGPAVKGLLERYELGPDGLLVDGRVAGDAVPADRSPRPVQCTATRKKLSRSSPRFARRSETRCRPFRR